MVLPIEEWVSNPAVTMTVSSTSVVLRLSLEINRDVVLKQAIIYNGVDTYKQFDCLNSLNRKKKMKENNILPPQQLQWRPLEPCE
jgi:hypothetical protein